MSKKFCILLFVVFGFVMMPSIAFACGTKMEKACCKKEMASKTEKKDCCGNDSHSKSKNQNGCNGKCGQALCSSPSVNIGIASAFQLETHNNVFDFSTEKQKFYQSVSFTAAGYSSIWLIPKIS